MATPLFGELKESRSHRMLAPENIDFTTISDDNGDVVYKNVSLILHGFGNDPKGNPVAFTVLGPITILNHDGEV